MNSSPITSFLTPKRCSGHRHLRLVDVDHQLGPVNAVNERKLQLLCNPTCYSHDLDLHKIYMLNFIWIYILIWIFNMLPGKMR